MTRRLAVVTGGAGFIGSHVVDLLLERGYAVRAIDNFVGGHERNLARHAANSDFSLAQADICKLTPDSTIFSQAEIVFHFAGIGDIVPSIENPLGYMDTNVQGTVRVLECARARTIEKFVYAASSSCYGLASTPTSENHPIDPLYPYALSKYQGEQAALHWYATYGLPANSIRIFNAYGPRVRTTGAYGAVFGVFLKQKFANKPFTVVGDGSQMRDFIHVKDVARAFLAAAESNWSGRIYNLGSSNPQSINRLVELLGGDVVFVPKRPGEPDCTFADITKIRCELDWQPTVSFEAGVSEMIADIDEWRDAPLWDPDSIADATRAWFRHLTTKTNR
jgi:UDP-glucose 4-epimerase